MKSKNLYISKQSLDPVAVGAECLLYNKYFSTKAASNILAAPHKRLRGNIGMKKKATITVLA